MVTETQSEERVELVLDSYRVRGDLSFRGGPRRLVDIMNTVDAPFMVVRNAEIDDPSRTDDQPRRFDVVQVHLTTLLFAIPHGAALQQKDPFEAVQKRPVTATISVPGFELTGSVYLLPEMRPESAQMLGMKHFVPLTDATITPAADPARAWRTQLVVINLARAVLFAPHVRVPAFADAAAVS